MDLSKTMSAVTSIEDELEEPEKLSLISKICTELEGQLGFGDKTMATHIVDLSKSSELVDKLEEKLKQFEMSGYL
ncbi:hypothetical protein CDL15_Pgr024331 [Punica granatum]|uniref:Uncharacterized protein n=1 Tax=Punica granatum TaxID=22663 RepID=A0A218XX76_PUNGR|nr:hypothetical protein CDL15_Pgr024331 [Punica granatum]PKI55995.1 hypothetical protein CRG98_023623 [Punica granatum]